MRKIFLGLLLTILTLSSVCAKAQTDSVCQQQPKENFVIASVCIASPGKKIYSALGHACVRLQCPDHELDYIYSFEAEDVRHNVLRFFAGRLKMRVGAIPTQEYIEQYRTEGRGVMEYPLNLPIHIKQRLWQQMDERLEQDPMPYDYMNHGCAVSVLKWIEEAIGSDSIKYAPWTDKYINSTRKDLAGNAIQDPWSHFFLQMFIAGEGDYADIRVQSKVIVPQDLIEVLSNAKVNNKELISKKPKVLLAQTNNMGRTLFTPFVVSLILLIVALLNFKLHWSCIDYVFIGISATIGLFLAYLQWISNLPCTEWNWLIIPFNPFILIFYRWRRYWALPYAAICIIWSVGMCIWPHNLVDNAHIILAITMASINVEYTNRKIRNK